MEQCGGEKNTPQTQNQGMGGCGFPLAVASSQLPMSLCGCRKEAEHCFNQEPGVPLQHKNDFQSGRHRLLPTPPPIFSGASAVFLFTEIVNSTFLRGHTSF